MNTSQELGHPLASLGINQLRDENKELRTQRDELLEALKRARPHIGVGYSAIQRYEITKWVDAAIAKAEGGAA